MPSVDELHALLEGASESPPYVMVGHSLGGLFGRVYDEQYPGEVEGFVFVDASHPEQDQRLPLEIRKLIEQRKSESDRRWLYRLAAPYRMFAPERSTARTAYWWRSFPEGVLGEGRAIDIMSKQAARTDTLGNRPVVVLSAGISLEMPNVSEEGSAAMREVWLELHEELAALSTNSDHRIIEGAGHYIHWDRPEEVMAAIRDVVASIREGEPVRRVSTATGQDRKIDEASIKDQR